MRSLVTIIFFLSLCFSLSFTKAEELEDKIVETEIVKPSHIIHTERLIGVIKAKYISVFKAKVPGTIEWIEDPGKEIKAGKEILRLQNNEAKKYYELAKNSAEVTQQKYERSLKLSGSNLVSKSALADDRINMLEAQKSVQEAKKEYDKYVFSVPFDSVIGVSKYRAGSQIQEGDELVTVYNPDELVVDIEIPETLLKDIKVGQKVFVEKKELKLDALQKFVDQKIHMAPAYIKYPCESCVVGTTVNVDLVISEKSNAISIPKYAIITEGGKNTVFIVKDNKAILTNIEIGEVDKDRVEVKAGLSAGDELIINGFQRLADGQAVKISGHGN